MMYMTIVFSKIELLDYVHKQVFQFCNQSIRLRVNPFIQRRAATVYSWIFSHLGEGKKINKQLTMD